MVSLELQNINYQPVSGLKKINADTNSATQKSQSGTSKIAFGKQTYQPAVNIRTTLTGKDEHKKYNTLMDELDAKYRRKLEYALKSGQLLKNNSNDKSTVLDNLYKIITEERDQGLDNVTILKECLDIISNP